MTQAICIQCASEKELALGRCGSCGLVPTGTQRALSVIASTRMLTEPDLAEVQRRIAAGEPFRPGRERIEEAGRVLAGGAHVEPFSFSRSHALLLTAGNVLLTPALGFAVWFGLRHRSGLGARQALWLTIPVSLLFLGVRIALWVWPLAAHAS